MLQRGDIAPDFDAIDCRGERVTIGEYKGKKKVVLFFFPRAFTPACTLEVRNFRDNHERISTAGAELIGVSVDRAERNCKFAEAEGLQFRLVGDESRVVSELYGVVWPVLRIDRRATFVIDEQGVIIEVIHHEVQVYRHLEDVLDRIGASKTREPV